MNLDASLNVADLGRYVRFYEALFGVPAHKLKADYANFDLQTPPLKLALNAAEEPGGRGRLNHLGLLVDRPEDVWAYKERLQAAGLATFEETIRTRITGDELVTRRSRAVVRRSLWRRADAATRDAVIGCVERLPGSADVLVRNALGIYGAESVKRVRRAG